MLKIVIDIDKLAKINPSIKGYINIVEKNFFVADTKTEVVNQVTGETYDVIMAGVADRESIRYVKLYDDGIKKLLSLSSRSQKLMGYIMKNLGLNEGTITLDVSRLKDVMPESEYRKAIQELLLEKCVFETDIKYEYAININYIFNGSRIAYIKYLSKKLNAKITKEFTTETLIINHTL